MKLSYLKKRYFTWAHYHFLEVRVTAKGKPYLVISQSNRREGENKSQKIVLFHNEIENFIELLSEYKAALDSKSYVNETCESRSSSKEGQPTSSVEEEYDDWDEEYINWLVESQGSTGPVYKRSNGSSSVMTVRSDQKLTYYICKHLNEESPELYQSLWRQVEMSDDLPDKSDYEKRKRVVSLFREKDDDRYQRMVKWFDSTPF